MKWYLIFNDCFVDPYVFEKDNVPGETYRTILIRIVFLRFRKFREDFTSQQDGYPAYNYIRLNANLDRDPLDRWIGRGEPIMWTPRSPNLS